MRHCQLVPHQSVVHSTAATAQAARTGDVDAKGIGAVAARLLRSVALVSRRAAFSRCGPQLQPNSLQQGGALKRWDVGGSVGAVAARALLACRSAGWLVTPPGTLTLIEISNNQALAQLLSKLCYLLTLR